MMTKGKLFTDGGARGNPGPAGLGAILFSDVDTLIDFDARYTGETTNNQAEYNALLLGIELAIKNGIKNLEVFMDSELAVKQMIGEYKVKNNDIAQIKTKIESKISIFDSITFNHVPRAQNKFADKLVNLILDAKS